jgi:hypothetical protein
MSMDININHNFKGLMLQGATPFQECRDDVGVQGPIRPLGRRKFEAHQPAPSSWHEMTDTLALVPPEKDEAAAHPFCQHVSHQVADAIYYVPEEEPAFRKQPHPNKRGSMNVADAISGVAADPPPIARAYPQQTSEETRKAILQLPLEQQEQDALSARSARSGRCRLSVPSSDLVAKAITGVPADPLRPPPTTAAEGQDSQAVVKAFTGAPMSQQNWGGRANAQADLPFVTANSRKVREVFEGWENPSPLPPQLAPHVRAPTANFGRHTFQAPQSLQTAGMMLASPRTGPPVVQTDPSSMRLPNDRVRLLHLQPSAVPHELSFRGRM